MCDYSLEAFASRKAKVGDKLEIPQFTHGFMRSEDILNTKVSILGGVKGACMTCVKEGTRLLLVRPGWRAREVTVHRHTGTAYRDWFKDYIRMGRETPLIVDLPKGTTAMVLSIPGVKPKAKAKPKAKKQSLETRLGLDKLNAKLPTAKEPAKVRAAYTRVRRPVRA